MDTSEGVMGSLFLIAPLWADNSINLSSALSNNMCSYETVRVVLAVGKNLLHVSRSYKVQISSDFSDTIEQKILFYVTQMMLVGTVINLGSPYVLLPLSAAPQI